MSLKTCAVCIIWFLFPLSTNNAVDAKRILVITAAPLYSHQIVYRSLCLALNKRGHEVVVLTTHPMRDATLKNYTEIDLSHMSSIISDVQNRVIHNNLGYFSALELYKYFYKLVNSMSISVFNEPEFKKLYRRDSNEKFDAIIIEALIGPSLLAVAHKFNAPVIGINTMGIHNCQRYVFGSPILTSHLSNLEFDTLVGENRIWQRLKNFIEVWSHIYYWVNNFVNTEQEIAQKYLGNDIPYIIDIMRNMSVLLVNDNSVFAYPRPEQTNVIFFNSIHIQRTPPSLPEDLRQFLNNATEGFIYVSFGSTINSYNLPQEVQKILIEVFLKLPYKIVWKFECDELPRKPDNVFISKWFPQQSILAHPNIKLFIYQGGLQSTEEAVHYAVPLLGIPLIFEQKIRIHRLVSYGVAISLELKTLTTECFDIAVRQILSDESYKEKMMYLSSLVKDQPYDSMDNVIWWIEFVMRRKGVNYLRFSGSDQPWYQRYDTDIIVLLIIILLLMTYIITLITFQILRFIFKIL